MRKLWWHMATVRGRRYIFWTLVQKLSLVGCIATATCALGVLGYTIISSVIAGHMVENNSVVLMAPFTAGIALMSVWGMHAAWDKANDFVDPRFKPYIYGLLLNTLNKCGVNQPVKYIEDNPENITAYLRMLNVTRFRIGTSDHKPAKEHLLRVWKPSNELVEEHRVATLVLPGTKELSRERQIETLINDRNLRTYDEIKGMLEETDEIPVSISEGAL